MINCGAFFNSCDNFPQLVVNQFIDFIVSQVDIQRRTNQVHRYSVCCRQVLLVLIVMQ